jgi:hypothetical protein
MYKMKIKKIIENSPTDFTKSIYGKITKECEYWRINDVLDLFKVIIDPALIGEAKTVKKYRDWIAHKNLAKPPPQNVLPVYAHRVLSEIVRLLGTR